MLVECNNWAAGAALMAAKAIVRGEPWSVMTRDADFKTELLRMIEWDHNLRYGSDRDVRYLGTRMRQWMDADIQERLGRSWLTFGADNRAEWTASLDLFAELAGRVASSARLLDFHHDSVQREVEEILRIKR